MNIASLLKGLSGLIWLAAIAVIFFVGLRAARKMPIKNSRNIIIILLVVAVVLTTVSSGLVFMNPEERGVVISAVEPPGLSQRSVAARVELDHPVC